MSEKTLDGLIYSALAGDTALKTLVSGRVFQDVAPEGAVFPFLIISLSASSDVDTKTEGRVLTDYTYSVRSTTKGASYASNYQIMLLVRYRS